MNELDLIFLLGALVAGLGGWRFGFVRRVIGWIGLVIGVVVASKLLPVVFETPETPEPGDLIRSLVVILGAGLIGQAVGHVVGGRMKGMLDIARFGLIDSAGGAVLGVAGVVITAWMFIPTMVQIQGWPAETARSSVVAARLTRALGAPADVLAGVGKSLGVNGLEDALSNIRNLNIDPVAPANSPVDQATVDVVRASVVKLSGPACDRTQSGSGFVVAPGLVVTNAHVVAGSEALTISDDTGLEAEGTIRYLDLRNDIALVAAPGLDRPPLPLVEAKVGDAGAILGFPGGGPLQVQPYTVAAVTTATARDIYDQGSFSRRIMILGSKIGPGDSGGPLITPDGSVAGVAFGIAPDRAETAYAIPTALLQGLVEQVSAEPLASGACRGE